MTPGLLMLWALAVLVCVVVVIAIIAIIASFVGSAREKRRPPMVKFARRDDGDS